MVKAWRELVTIPTYEVGKPEKIPMFLEKRVYQGSSGVVYPYPVIESISNEKKNVEYLAVWLENEYIKVMILPELGGRVQMAYDKIKKRHFVYYNHVIKPALVGLAGPWISGGIEFNWPQHHRPSTFMPVDVPIRIKTAVYLVESIFESTLLHTYLCSLKISSIGTCLAPCRLPKKLVSLCLLTLIFQTQGKIVDWF
jgi:hypothetical protein